MGTLTEQAKTFDELSPLVKIRAVGSYEREKERNAADKVIIEASNISNVEELIHVSEDIKIFKVRVKPKELHLYHNNEYYYQGFIRGKGKVNEISYDIEHAILITLGHKYEGGNSRFASYALRMLKGEI